MISFGAENWQVGGGTYILASFIYLICEAISAIAWSTPLYKYYFNFISDLGVPMYAVFDDRIVNSPLDYVMNFEFFAHGILFLWGFCIIMNLFSVRDRTVILGLSIVHCIGIIMVTIFPGYDYWGLKYHFIGAVMAICAGDFALLYTGLALSKCKDCRNFSLLSVSLGVIGIISACLCKFNTLGYPAVFERISVYTIMGWDILFGILLIKGCMEISFVNLKSV
ncbi:hypothetical protein CN285_12540 [Bacillus cereus]|nr:hypothetical protein CN285_12540 [Bacillus cereus]